MKANLHRQTDLVVNRHGVRARREFLRAIAEQNQSRLIRKGAA